MSQRRKILIGVAIVFGVAVIAPVLRHFQLKAEVERYKTELKAKGELMELAQVSPPPVPPEQNAAPVFLKAASLLITNWNVLGSNPPPMMRMIAPGKAMIGWKLPFIRDGRASNSWAEVEVVLASDNDALILLRGLTNRMVFDFQINFGNEPERIPLPQLTSAKTAAQRLLAAANVSLHRGDAAGATENIKATLAIVQGMSHDQIIISELVRMAVAQMALAGNWEFLLFTNSTDEQLASLQNDWEYLEFMQAEERALEMERGSVQISLVGWRRSNLAFRHYAATWEGTGQQIQPWHKTAWKKLKVNGNIFLWRRWWSYPDELCYLQGIQALLETTRQAHRQSSLFARSVELKKEIAQLGIVAEARSPFWFSDPSATDYHSFLSSLVISLSRTFDKVVKMEVSRQMVVTAIALKRFQLKHGSFPEKISALTPEFLSSIPLDPMDGQPLRYRRNADGTFLLYSIGENGRDDGGDAALEKGAKSQSLEWQNASALDWVWPQPATPAEVERYFAEQAAKSN